jgi:UDP-N-acetylmuramoyl-L-alanyl-D-glutamate--2,6-diaminopimelate ligase
MKTRDLLNALPEARIEGDLPGTVSGLQYDSRQVTAGDVFICLEGLVADGHRYAGVAAGRGATLVVARRVPDPRPDVPLVLVPDTREALARLAAAFHGYPSRELKLAAVTGTNGKTTTTHFHTAIAAAAGETVGRIGTVGYDYAGIHVDAPHTTPEAPVLNDLLRRMVGAGVRFAAMEASSHALDQRRVFGLDFAGILFTNLTQDHLDYHPDLEAYYVAKRRLFRQAERGMATGDPVAAINVDDPAGRRLAGEAEGPVVTFGLDSPADYRASISSMDRRGTAMNLETPEGPLSIHLRMVGPFNVLNAAGSAALMREIGYESEAIVRGLESLAGVPGRMEPVDRGQPFLVLVDYAHTPDALERVLQAARAAAKERLLAVFGCGGDRDRTKRPIMGRLATALADFAIITSDNPRSEVPEAIVREIEAGAVESGGRYETVVDRRSAIEKAIRMAKAGDVVVIAGKGHEPYQILSDRTIHFDDREEAARVLEDLGHTVTHGG